MFVMMIILYKTPYFKNNLKFNLINLNYFGKTVAVTFSLCPSDTSRRRTGNVETNFTRYESHITDHINIAHITYFSAS